MNMLKRSFTILFLLAGLLLNAQSECDTIASSKKGTFKDLIFPSLVSFSGVAIQLSGKKADFQDFLHSNVGRTETHIDDYIQYVPAVQVLGGDFLGVRSKYHWFDRSKYLFISQAISSVLTTSIKYLVRIQRPDGSSFNSFPSGHTNLAFVGAENLYQSYKDTAPVYAWSGYLFASTVGTLRMTNNRHWLPDVVLGVGLGMLVTRLVYHWKPLKDWNPFRRKKKIALVFMPAFATDYRGGGLQIRF